MFAITAPAFLSRRSQKYATKMRHRFRNGSHLPIAQTAQQRRESVHDILRTRRINSGNESAYHYVEKKLYSPSARLQRTSDNVNATYAMQGLGDLEPLRNSASFGLSEAEKLKYDSAQDMEKHAAPPVMFNALAARKLADGKLWPAATEPTGMMSREVRLLRHETNMSPSARSFTAKIEYHLRRSLRACPPHIAEHIDFAQLVIQEVIASRRSKEIYIVWSCVDPGARFELEPQLLRLSYWVQRLIVGRIKSRPHIPHINWIYDGGRLERELPHNLREELSSLVGETQSTLKDRVKYLKEMDSMGQRIKDIPWFMPYLWNKDKKANTHKSMLSDLETVERRSGANNNDNNNNSSSRQGGKREYTVNRGTAAQTNPPPSFQR